MITQLKTDRTMHHKEEDLGYMLMRRYPMEKVKIYESIKLNT